MSFVETLLVGLGLSMDAVAVALSDGMIDPSAEKAKRRMIPLLFGFFQGFMPFLGYHTGSLFAGFISRCSGLMIFGILGLIGGKMIWDGFHEEPQIDKHSRMLTYRILFFQAIATSIDAFAVGVGYCAAGVPVLRSSALIALTTCLCCALAVLLGKRFGTFLGNKAEIFGGSILVAIGIKAILF